MRTSTKKGGEVEGEEKRRIYRSRRRDRVAIETGNKGNQEGVTKHLAFGKSRKKEEIVLEAQNAATQCNKARPRSGKSGQGPTTTVLGHNVDRDQESKNN